MMPSLFDSDTERPRRKRPYEPYKAKAIPDWNYRKEEPFRDKNHKPEVEDLYFPVKLRPLFWEMEEQLLEQDATVEHYECPRHFAVVRMDDLLHTFSTVTDGYCLVLNKDAMDLGTKVAKYLFHYNSEMTLETAVMDVSPYGAACEVSIHRSVEKGQPQLLNGWKAIVRISNSYNKTKQLTYRAGFEYEGKYGILFPMFGIEVKNAHSLSFMKVSEVVMNKVETQPEGELIQELEGYFVKLVNGLMGIRLSEEDMLRLFCKVYKLKKTKEERDNNFRKLHTIEVLIKKYQDKIEKNAYRMLIVFSEYVTEAAPNKMARDLGHDQLELGKWAQQFVEASSKEGFSLSAFFGNDVIDLVCDYLSSR